MEAAGLTDLLQEDGDYTLFAPSDEALAGLTERDITVLKSKSQMFSLFSHIFTPMDLQLFWGIRAGKKNFTIGVLQDQGI